MEKKNNKLNSLLQNVASSILTNDNGVINVDKETGDAIAVDSDDASVVVVGSTEEGEDDDDEEDDNDGDMNGVGVVTLTTSL